SGWGFKPNDWFDANTFFGNQTDTPRQGLRLKQFGGDFGGPNIKDKLVFFLSFQGNHLPEAAPPSTVTVESPEWRQAVISAIPNSAATLLYKDFAPTITGDPAGVDLDAYTGGNYTKYLCGDGQNAFISARLAPLIGVTAADQAAMATAGCGSIP